ncbi:hypothetical protein llap_14762 [Limosa lapponica baueri]|uniref:NHR domain-containing protein n=1 Tax=Limosa lapponica baueri TaxID=1758121 RepID=A0A2I0TMF7_LIMLA|nr:hypothetical protein llap_14762 [Limosa lapponica baueri]
MDGGWWRNPDSIGGSFSTSSHRCHHKQKHCLPIPQCGALSISPLLFHPHTKGSQIIMDTTQKAVKRQASFCNAITFSNRPIIIYEQVRLKWGEDGRAPLGFDRRLRTHPRSAALGYTTCVESTPGFDAEVPSALLMMQLILQGAVLSEVVEP